MSSTHYNRCPTAGEDTWSTTTQHGSTSSPSTSARESKDDKRKNETKRASGKKKFKAQKAKNIAVDTMCMGSQFTS